MRARIGEPALSPIQQLLTLLPSSPLPAYRLPAVFIELIEPDQDVPGFAPVRRAEYSSVV